MRSITISLCIWILFFSFLPVKIFSALHIKNIEASVAEAASSNSPSALFIPSINLAASIEHVGTNSKGEMSVPNIPSTVGWYKEGTKPGEMGSAVLDAHVYLAFKNLKNIKAGESIYVTTKKGDTLRFLVSDVKSYAYTKVPLTDLFTSSDDKRLNLITCAGKWLQGQGTYDHRLVVYTKLVQRISL